jgi:hypothetical protein
VSTEGLAAARGGGFGTRHSLALDKIAGAERKISGERGRNRTFNLVIKSHLLCQLSYAPDASEKINLEGTGSVYNRTL